MKKVQRRPRKEGEGALGDIIVRHGENKGYGAKQGSNGSEKNTHIIIAFG